MVLGGDRQAHGLDVQLEVLVPLDGNGLAASYLCGERVHAEGGRGDDYVVAGAHEHAQQQIDDLVSAIAGDDLVRRHVQVPGQGLPQPGLAGVRVVIVFF